jgi:hypothetical protein
VVLLVALALRLIQLNHAPHFDEFYHLLAANSRLADGDMCIAECLHPYNRGGLFTMLVAGAIGIFGDSLVSARLVPLLGGLLLTVGVFAWTWHVAGRTAAVVAGLLVALSPEAIFISQFIRFYAWQALLVWVGATAVFLVVHPPSALDRRRRIVLLAGAAVALFGAFSLQVTSLIALAALGVWLLIDPIATWAAGEAKVRPRRLAILVGGTLVLGAAAAFVAYRSGMVDPLWARYRQVNMFEVAEASDIRYYHNFFLRTYPTLYTLLPVAFVISLWKHPAAAKFCAAMFGVSIVAHSGGGFKATRFVFYTMPFFFALWGLALSAVLPPLAKAAREGMASWLGAEQDSRRATVGGALLVGVAALAVLASNSAYNTTWKMATLTDAEWPASKPLYRGRPEWRPAVATIKAITDTAEVVVTSASVKAHYFLNRSDVEIDASRLFYSGGFNADFWLDWRVGQPVIRTADAMDRLISCYSSGVVVMEKHSWGTRWRTIAETAEFIASHLEELPLPDGSDLRLFRWGPDTQAGSIACDSDPLAEALIAGQSQ